MNWIAIRRHYLYYIENAGKECQWSGDTKNYGKSGLSLTIVWPLASNLNSLGLRENEEVGLYQWFSAVSSEPVGVAVGPPLGLYQIT